MQPSTPTKKTRSISKYHQLEKLFESQILKQELVEGAAFPALRDIAAQYEVNFLTVSRALKALAAADLVESRRGSGTYVKKGAHQLLVERETLYFLKTEWPNAVEKARLLGLNPMQLLINDERVSDTSEANEL